MDKYKRYCIWGSLFLVISCSNLSNFCRHQGSASAVFNYKEVVKINNGEVVPLFASQIETAQYDSENTDVVKIYWDALSDVTFELRYNNDYKMDINYPVFGNNVKKLKGKELYITGYIIPLNPAAGLYAVSKNNFASCFFCGRAGPESIISLKFKTTPRRYKTDEYLTMKGRMELNDSNIRDFIYIFRDTEEFSP